MPVPGGMPPLPKKRKKKRSSTGVGPQGLPIQSTSPARKHPPNKAPRTSVGPQGLPTQGTSPARARSSRPRPLPETRKSVRRVRRKEIRSQRRSLRVSGDQPMTAAERRANDRSVNKTVLAERYAYLRRTHKPLNIGDLVGGFLQSTAKKVDVTPGPELAGIGDPSGKVDRAVALIPGAGWNLLRATAEDPIGVAGSSARTAVESIAGLPQGIKMLATHPGEALQSMGKDYAQRYGTLLNNPAKFRENVKKDYGLTPYLLDLGAGGSAAGRTLGAAARTERVAAAGERLARAPRGTGIRAVGRTIQAANRERPSLRWTGDAARPQSTSKNIFIARGQHRLDEARARKFDKRRQHAESDPNVRLPGVQPGRGEVVPLFGEGPGHRLRGKIAKDIGHQKSKQRVVLLRHRDREIGEIRRATRKLKEPEQDALKYAIQFGIRTPKQARAILRRHLVRVEANRAKLGTTEVSRLTRQTTDELPVLRRVLANPEAAFTPAVAEAAQRILAVQRRTEFNDPNLPAARATARRLRQQGEVLGVQRGPHVERVLKALEKERVRNNQTEGLASLMPDERKVAAKKLRKSAERELEQAKADLKRMQGRGEVLTEGLVVHEPNGKPAGQQRPQAGAKGIADAKARVDAAKKRVDMMRKTEQVLSKKRNKVSEPIEKYEKRVQQAAKETGLADPGYYMSSPRPEQAYSNAAVGSGGKATGASKRYTGELHRLGMEETGVSPLQRGVERNLKRRFQWALVQRNMEVHAFDWSKNNGKGLTREEIERQLSERQIDPDTVSYVNPQQLRVDHPHDQADEANLDVPDEEALRATHRELVQSIHTTLDDAEKIRTKGVAMNRYLVVPRTVGEELLHMSKPESGFARGWEIVMKQKPARVLLGAANVPWLSFQVASNAFLTGLGGGFNPLDIYGAMKMWKGMTPDEQIAWETEIGITKGGYQHLDQRHLGSTANRYGPIKHMVDFWHAYRHSKVGRYGPQTAPRHLMDLMFKADETQNNFFRKVLFYNRIKRDAYKEMGKNWSRMDREKSEIVAILKKPPNEAIHAVMRNEALFERHAEHVKEFLGNYLEFTDKERRLLSRNVMFYGYLRYSLRFAFYSLPVHHPILAEIGQELGRMGSDEIKRLFGVPQNEGLPTRYLGKIYSGEGANLESVDLGRMNPALNQVVGMERLSQSLGLVSPIYGMLMEQIFQESAFTGNDWALSGEPRQMAHERPATGEERGRVALASVLGFAFPYRLAKKTGIPALGVKPMLGPQGQDSLLWDQRPTQYKSPEVVQSIQQSTDRERKRGFGGALRDEMLPLVMPTPDIGPELVKRDREKAGKGVAPQSDEQVRRSLRAAGISSERINEIIRLRHRKK